MTTKRVDVSGPGFSDDDSPPASNLSSMQRAIVTIQKMRTKLEALERARTEPIAIVGMACRIPGGANTPESFFKLLEDGVDTISEIPADRWRVEQEGANSEGDTRALRWGSFLTNVDRFDAAFFGISPREAESMDPQHRLLLEVTWEALERAGQLPERLMGTKTGVFVGIWAPDYQLRVLTRDPNDLDAYCFTGTVLSTAAGRLSYILGVQGPCMAIDTACSSSLTAIHLACQSLRSGESTMAIAGGVNLMLAPSTTHLLSKTQALSPDGRCKTFDARANGYVRGEGCGMLVLKRLSDAERDGDSILALIRGSAVNQDGRSTGLTAPNVLSQQALLRQALESARLSPQDIAYLETHGTGTSLGDPIEVEAIKAVFGAPRDRGAKCVLGALKSNIGHLEAAAGVAGLIKAVLAMQYEKIPGNLHFRSLNPRIDLGGTPLEIAQTAKPWTPGVRPRYAGISSFGISGTNAHVIIEEPPKNLEEALLEEESATLLLPISAKTQGALRAHAAAYRDMLRTDSAPRLLDIVYTASARRSHYVHRLSVVGRTKHELAEQLDAYLQGHGSTGVAEGKASPARAKIVFVFSGQGSQWLGMGRQLYESDASFRSVIDTCDNLMTSRLGWSILDELDAPETMSRINDTQVAQPLLFAVQVALVEMLRSWGISPDAMIGHSVGEIAAAHIAGILSLDEAIRLVAIRGRIMQKATGMGKMVSVAMTPSEAQAILVGYEDRVAIAAINDPNSVVLSGASQALDDIVLRCERKGHKTRPLRPNYAFHSPQMDVYERELVDRITRVDARRATLAMYSTILGDCVDGKELDVHYWGSSIRRTVDFVGAVTSAIRDGYQLFLEIGPHPGLVRSIQQCLASKNAEGYVIGTLRHGYEERRALLEMAGGLHTRGCSIEWARVLPSGGRCVPLPTYPWQRERYWVDLPKHVASPSRNAVSNPAAADSARPKVVFVFPGQGSQWLGMGRQLFAEEPAFRDALSACDAAIRHESGFSVWDELQADEFTSRLDEVDVVQPILFAMEVALASLWRSKGVEPDCVVGHSMGEVAAAHIAGMLSLEDAVQIICRRSRLLKRISGQGAMALVELTVADAEASIVNYSDKLSVAVSNGPRSTVLAGETHALDEVLARLEARGVYCRRVKVDVASHSPQVDPLRRDLLTLLRNVQPNTGRVTMWSTVTRAQQQGPELVAAYWAANLREPVHFSNVTQSLIRDGYRVFVEMSPHPILTVSIEENLRELGAHGIAIASMRRETNEQQTMLDALSSLRQYSHTVARNNPLAANEPHNEEVTDPYANDLFEIVWQQSDLSTASEEGKALSESWLVLMNSQGIGKSLCEKLRDLGNRVVEVVVHDEYARTGPDAFHLNPTDPDQWELVLTAAFGKSACHGIIDCLPLDTTPMQEITGTSLHVDIRNATFSLLRLVQSVLKRSWRDTPRLYVLTRGAQSVNKSDISRSLTQATVWGFGRVMAVEQPDMGCHRIDLPSQPASNEAALIVRELVANTNEDEIAFRFGKRYVSRLVRGTWNPSETPSIDAMPATRRSHQLESDRSTAEIKIRGDSTYLVTIAGHSLGISSAQWLAQNGARHIVLVGGDLGAAETESAVANIRKMGAMVHSINANIAEPSEVEAIVARIKTEMPPLRGIAHTASVDEEQSLTMMEEKPFFDAIEAKAVGGWNLHHVTRTLPLDFFIVYSSTAGLVGTPGRANTASANAFTDALCLARAAEGLPGMSIQWGAIVDAAEPRPSHNNHLTSTDRDTIMQRLLAAPRGVAGVMRFDVRQWLGTFPQLAARPFFAELRRARKNETQTGQSQAFRATLMNAPEAERSGLLEVRIRQIVADVLHTSVTRIERTVPFREIGVDSLMSVEVRNRLERELDLVLPATLLFTYAHSGDLARHLLAQVQLDGPPEIPKTMPPLRLVQSTETKAEQVDDPELLAMLDEELSLAYRGSTK